MKDALALFIYHYLYHIKNLICFSGPNPQRLISIEDDIDLIDLSEAIIKWASDNQTEKSAGVLEVGLLEKSKEVVINHPDLKPDALGVGHIVFSPEQARNLGHILINKADEIEKR